jgi:hypothetical protein
MVWCIQHHTMRHPSPPDVMPVEPNTAQDREMKTNGEGTPSRTSARHEVIAGITSCVTPDEKHAPGNNMKRLQERDLAEASGDLPVPARHASNRGTSGL